MNPKSFIQPLEILPVELTTDENYSAEAMWFDMKLSQQNYILQLLSSRSEFVLLTQETKVGFGPSELWTKKNRIYMCVS